MAYSEERASLIHCSDSLSQNYRADISHELCYNEKASYYHRCGRRLELLHLTYTIAITLLAGVLFAQTRVQQSTTVRTMASVEVETPFPEIPTTAVVFQDQPEYSDSDLFEAFVNGSAVGSAWEKLHLKNNFWLQLPIDADRGLTGGLPPRFFGSDSTNTQAFAPALHHQLHCVVGVPEQQSHMTYSAKADDKQYQLKIFISGIASPTVTSEHASHCLEMIRQAVMCLGDMSLEKPAHIDDNGWKGITGWGTTHICKDWSAIDAIASQHGIKEDKICSHGCVDRQ